MIKTTLKNKQKILGIAIAVVVFMTARTSFAQNTNLRIGYSMQVSSDLGLIQDPNDPQAVRSAQWRTDTQMELFRTTPVFRITNNAEVSIKSFMITIPVNADRDYLFDTSQILEAPDNGAAQINNPLDNLPGGDQSNVLEIIFPNGLNPGDSFALRVDLMRGPSMPTGMADFRTALWDPNDFLNPDETNNAFVTVVFDTPAGFTNDTLESAFFDLPTFTDLNRSEGTASGSSTIFNADGLHMQDVGLYDLSQLTTIVVPEPSTIALLICSAFSFVGFRCIRRRRKFES